MSWNVQLYIAIVLLSSILTSILAAYAWRHRSTPGAPAFVGFMALVVFWEWLTLLGFLPLSIASEVFRYNLRYLTLAGTPLLLLFFTIAYTGRQQWLTKGRLLLLASLPFLTQCFVWYHGAQGRKFQIGTSHWYGVHTIYSFGLIALSLLLIVSAMLRASFSQRKQLMWVLLGILLPVLTTFLYTFDVMHFGKIEFTSIAMAGTGLCFAWSLFRFQFLDVAPIARAAVVDSMEDPMLVLDLKNRLLDLNRAAEKLIGKTRHELLGQSSEQALGALRELKSALEENSKDLQEIDIELRGTRWSYEFRMSPFYDQKRRPSGRIVLLRDISGRKRAEATLRESQEKLERSYKIERERRRLSDTLREAVTIVGSSLETRRVVSLLLDELQKVVAYDFASVMLLHEDQLTRLIRRNAKGDSFYAFTFPVDAYPINAEALREKKPIVVADVTQDSRWKGSSETGGISSLLNTPLLVQEQPIGVLSIGRDQGAPYNEEEANVVFAFAIHVAIAIKNARLAEQTQLSLNDLQETLDRLQRTQKRLIDSEKMAALGKLVANIAHEINTPIGAIRASAKNISFALQESVSQLPEVLGEMHEEEQALFMNCITRALREKQALSSSEERKLRRTLRRTLEVFEIDDADYLADHLVDMGIYDRLEELLPLFRHDKHELLVQAAYNLTIQQHHNQNILTAVDRAAKVVFALKSYAHFDSSGRKSVSIVSDGIDVALTLYHNQLKQGIEIVKQYEDVAPILCYPDELTQVWANLIHNAIQAMQGRGRLEISVDNSQEAESSLQEAEAESRKQYIVVEICDSGSGIPEEIQERIFEPFFTTKSSGEGSGLGLDICKKIIEKHQGKISFESRPGRTCFSVRLPVQ